MVPLDPLHEEYRVTINGVITDPSGPSVPGARISAVNFETGVALRSEANAQGHHVIPYLLPGQSGLATQAGDAVTCNDQSLRIWAIRV